jgi:hypothetical protein
MTTKKQIARGSASIFITKQNGNITVYHGSDGVKLFEIKNVEEGSWDKIWKTIHSLKSVK